MATTYYKIEPDPGFGKNPFGNTGKEAREYGRGFGDPTTEHQENNAEGSSGTPTYTEDNDD